MDTVDTKELIKALNDNILSLNKSVQKIESETKEMREVFQALQGLFTVVTFIGKVAKPLTWIIGVITAISYYFHNIKVPKLPT